MTSTDSGRTYNGRSADARRVQRRDRWLASALELFGTLGYHHTTVRALADHSGVAARYFSESFAGTEDLFLAVHDAIHDDMVRAVQSALSDADDSPEARIRAGASALLHEMTVDPRITRIKLIEAPAVGSTVTERQRSALREIASMIQFCLPPGKPGIDMTIICRGLAGSVIELVLAHHDREFDVDDKGLIEHMVAMCMGIVVSCCVPATHEALDLSTAVDR